MKITRTKFIVIFLISVFVFQFITTSLLGTTGPRGFPQPPDTFLNTASTVTWKRTVSTIILPIKFILVAPVLPFNNFLREDPPPPFVAAVFTLYWSILASTIYSVLLPLKK